MAKPFYLTVARVGEHLFDGDVHAVVLPGVEGVFTILAGHEAFVTELAQGEVKIETVSGEKKHLPIPHGGVAEISNNQATILL